MQKFRYFHPMTILRILYLNFRYSKCFDIQHLILINRDCILNLAKSAKITVEKGARLNFGFFSNIFAQKRKSQLILEEDSELKITSKAMIQSGVMVYAAKGKTLTIARSTINSTVKILAYNDISIGNNCIFGWESKIGVKKEPSLSQKQLKTVIEDDVWVGSCAIIFEGVKISQGSIIASNAVVMQDVPPWCVAAGNPAKIVKENISWKE